MTDSASSQGRNPSLLWRHTLRTLLLGGLVGSLPCCGCPLFFNFLPSIKEWQNRIPFDAEGWKTANDHEVRYHMSWDLVHGGILTGKTPGEVEALIGKPRYKDVFDQGKLPLFDPPRNRRGVETWYYDLGNDLYDNGLGPSGAVLCVDFKNGKVFDVRKIAH